MDDNLITHNKNALFQQIENKKIYISQDSIINIKEDM